MNQTQIERSNKQMNKKIIAQNQEIVIGTDVSTVKHNVAVTDAVSGDVLYNGTLKTSEAEWDRLFSRLPGCRTVLIPVHSVQEYTVCKRSGSGVCTALLHPL